MKKTKWGSVSVGLAVILGVLHLGLLCLHDFDGPVEFLFHIIGVAVPVLLVHYLAQCYGKDSRIETLEEYNDRLHKELRAAEAKHRAAGPVQTHHDQSAEALLGKYGGMSIHDIARDCGKPEGAYIGRDDLPHQLGENGEDTFLFWTSLTGEIFHRRRGCHHLAVYPCNAADIRDRRPCPRCRPDVPDLSWHIKYRAVIREFENRGLPHPPVHNEGAE